MTKPLFSIVIPVYNVKNYLKETVCSISNQLHSLSRSVEILLVDDGSTDGSSALCDSLSQEFPHIRVFHKENEGLLLTRRFGFRQACGEYIINCDSDDTLEPNALGILAEAVSATSADVILYNINTWDGTKKSPFSDNIFTHDSQSSPNKEDVLRGFFHCAGAASMCGKIFKRSCLDIEKDYSRFYKKSFGEDTLQSAEIYTNAQSFLYINRGLYNYRTSTGMTGKMNPHYFQDFTQVNAALEAYQPLWQLADFDVLVAEKIFTNACRAITQVRYDSAMTQRERLHYYKAIREHEMLQKYKPFYNTVKPLLKKSYRIFATFLLQKQYLCIDLLVQIRKHMSGIH